jgi:hypothetical protein
MARKTLQWLLCRLLLPAYAASFYPACVRPASGRLPDMTTNSSPFRLLIWFFLAALAFAPLSAAEQVQSAEDAILSFKAFLAGKESRKISPENLKQIRALSEGARELKVLVAMKDFRASYDPVITISADSRFNLFGSFESVKKAENNVWILDYYDGLGGAMRVYLNAVSGLPLQIHSIPTGE